MTETYLDIDNAEHDTRLLVDGHAGEICRAFTQYESALEYVGAMFYMTFNYDHNIFLNCIQNDTEMLVTTRLADAVTVENGEQNEKDNE